jgi:hypothetical protein
MDETAGQIEQHINQERQNLGQNINELENKVKNALEWRVQVREHPLTMVGIAFGVGVVASMFIDGRIRDYNGGYTSASSGAVGRKARREWNVVKSAIGAVILAEAKDFVRQMFPRFEREYERREYATGARARRTEAAEWPSTAEPGTEEL